MVGRAFDRIKVLVFLYFAISPWVLFGQIQYKFKHITVEHGLSSNRVVCVYRDARQFLWIGTDMGLNRYDGYSTTHYFNDTTKGSLSDNTLRCIGEDAEGNLLVGTTNGLNLYDRESDSFIVFRNNPSDPSSLSNNNINSIYRDKKGNVWVMAGGNCLNQWLPKEKKFKRYLYKEDDHGFYYGTQSIGEDSKGNLWIVTFDRGLYCLKQGSTKVEAITGKNLDFGANMSKSLYVDNQNIVWIATNGNGFYSYDPMTGKSEHFEPDESSKGPSGKLLRWVIPEGERYLLIAANQGGINRFDKHTKTFEFITSDENARSGLNSNSIWSLYWDEEGILWVGTSNGGLNYYNPKEYNFETYSYDRNNPKFSPSFNAIGSFYEDKEDKIWISTDGGGINVFDPASKTFTKFSHNPRDPFSVSSNTIRNIIEGKGNNVWVATWNAGLNRYDRQTGRFYRYLPSENPSSISGPSVWQVLKDSRGLLWLAIMYVGIDIFDEEKGVVKRFKPNKNDPNALGTNVIRQLFEDQGKYMWACTWQGLFRYDYATDKFASIQSLGDNDILGLFKDSKGNYWVSVSGKGIYLMDFNGSIRKIYNDKNGMPNNQVHAVIEDDKGMLWISTNNGLCCFDPNKETFKVYHKEDGLQSDQFFRLSFLKDHNGKLYFGGFNGFNAFHPDSLKANKTIPPVYITGLEIFNKPVPFGQKDSPLPQHISSVKEFSISWKQSVFSLGFSALNYTFSEKNQYAYMLEGFDKDWNNVGSKRSATYTNLNPGDYVFKVKASNNDGIWNEQPASVIIHILPPWWKTWWAMGLLALLAIGIFVLILTLRTRNIKKMNRTLQRMVEQSTKELTESNRILKLNEVEINAKNEMLHDQSQELAAQNEELVAIHEEITSQRNALAKQNENLIKAHQTIQEQNENLEEEVTKRTNELVEYNQQLEQFAFTSAHNLRAPVARLLGLGNLMKMLHDKPEERELIFSKLTSTTIELDNVVKDLNSILSLKRNSEAYLLHVNLDSSVNAIRINLDQEISQSHTNITTDFTQVPTVVTVKAYLNSILYNLISNAIKYKHPDRTPNIHLYSKEIEDTICLTVSDNGIGIDLPSCKDKLFRLYSRFHSHVEGKGMGLYLVKTQVASLGGKIEVESEVNKGTTFRIFLKKQQDQFAPSSRA